MEEKKSTTEHRLNKKQLQYLPIKRMIDFILSIGAIIILSPMLAGIAIAIKIDSPGPILFKQKRVGKNKKLFDIYKFRTMYRNTPENMPTHMLVDPEQYITKVGKFLRKTSLDELPQLFNIIKGDMYIVSSRPSLWNQYDLIEERDKYGVHIIAPGLTGWAQINGRDKLEIPAKAKLDGEYIEKFCFWMDLKCFFGTISSVLTHDGIIEGGTSKLYKKKKNFSMITSLEKRKQKIIIDRIICIILGIIILYALKKFCKYISKKNKLHKVNPIIYIVIIFSALYTFIINIKRIHKMNKISINKSYLNSINEKEKLKKSTTKNILITGANSFIGISVETWLNKFNGHYLIDTVDMIGNDWENKSFSKYDVVYHVAGIAHADMGNITNEQKDLYYKINTKLAVSVAQKAKREGVKQFIFMSSMIIYLGCKEKVISTKTKPIPLNVYGDSKWQAEKRIRKMEDDSFKVVVLRPPMIYGKGSKGNYPELVKLATKLPIFPIVKNKRSMLYIDNLAQFVKLMIDNEEKGVFFPQNGEYTNTSDMVQMIAKAKGYKIIMVPFTNLFVKLLGLIPNKIGALTKKAFGDFTYEMSISDYKECYQIRTLMESIQITEGKYENNMDN